METIKINGHAYKISFVDTQDTVKNMIALKEKVIPRFIKFTIFKPPKVRIQLLPQELKKIKATDLAKKLRELQSDWDVSMQDLALEWLHVNNKKVTETSLLFEDFKKIDNIEFWSAPAIDNLYSNLQREKKDILDGLSNAVKKEELFRKEYENFTPLETTKFLQDSVIVEYQMTIDKDPLDVFNSISLTKTIPFARLKTFDQVYYKVAKDLTPQATWLEGDSTLIFKLYRPSQDGWGTATLEYTSFIEPFTAKLTIDTLIDKKSGTDEDEIKNAIMSIFSGVTINITNREEKGVKGVFAVPDTKISRDVFLDLVTNEPMVSHYLYVDEVRESSSVKGVLYLFYSVGDNDKDALTVFLSDRVAARSDPFYLNKELPLFSPYLNVRVSRAMSLDQIDRFMKTFATILDIYNKKFSSIANYYNALIPGFKAANKQDRKKVAPGGKLLKELQMQDPELFINGYAIKCEKKKQPSAINDPSAVKKGVQVMNYPKGSTNYFICDNNDTFKFPGLMVNKLTNKDVYSYLPCCYTVNQRTGQKKLNVYEKGITKSKGKSTGPVTKKAIERGATGLLPRNIHYILRKHGDFKRMGTEIGPNSFIEAVLLALDKNYASVPTADKREYVQDFRNNLASLDLSSVVQELYDTDKDDIVNDILSDVNFDSKIFIGLLEAFYKCQIVVFERPDSNSNAEFEIPRYTQGYLFKKLDPNVKTVFVYKHLGIRGDNLENPHYELIVRQEGRLTTWHFTGKVVNDVYSYFLQSYKLFMIGIDRYRAINTVPFSATYQVVDQYGKCRGFVIGDIYIATSPLSPFNLEITEVPEERPGIEQVLKFIRKHKLKILKQDTTENKTIGFVIDIPGIPYVYIPVKPGNPQPGIDKDTHLGFTIPGERDILAESVENKKIADFLMQFLLYRFSLWYEANVDDARLEEIEELDIAEQNVKDRDYLLELASKFIDSEVIIKPDHDYNVGNVPRYLTINNSFFANDQLIVDSEKTQEKLGYYLNFMINKNKGLVKNYSAKKYLENYYTYANDFDSRPGQMIFIGDLSISNWIDNQKFGISNQVHTIAHPNNPEPYFFSHWAINGGKPIVFQNVKSGRLGRALAVAKKFQEEKINSGFNTPPIDKIDHTVYYLEKGILKKKGSGNIRLWQFDASFYAAMLF